ncbi:SURF1 family protein [Brevundimonas sp. 2R-24]|uniref:SURF1-like protein n=1 Tax=Peiella sedimenti TaxID=3061083 RepID=A0ABT8SHK0_9CAUL|nr:SURF1 family protein [Caulobacteraceae bacterium XZ-24]
MFATLCGLGVWQVRRMMWKEDLIARAEAAAARPPVPIQTLARLPDAEFRTARVTCLGLSRAPYLELHTVEDAGPGVRLVSLCRTPQGGAWLIDRGFVAAEVSARPPEDASDSSPTNIDAVLRRHPEPNPFAPQGEGRTYFTRQTESMAQTLGASAVGPYLLYATTSSNPEWRALQPSAPPPAFSNNHAGYAITWFGLSAVLAVMVVVVLRRRR